MYTFALVLTFAGQSFVAQTWQADRLMETQCYEALMTTLQMKKDLRLDFQVSCERLD
jgi:hypothetical protein